MKKSQVILFGVTIFVLLFCGIALAQSVTEILKEAEALLNEGKMEEAQEKLDAARLILWNELPMQIKNVTLIEEKASSFGNFRERASNLFTKDETIFAYAEPKNYTLLYEDGVYHVSLAMDYVLYDEEGNELIAEKEFGSFRYIAKSPIFEVFFNLSFDFSGLEAGNYFIEVTMRDKLSDKMTQFQIPFKIR